MIKLTQALSMNRVGGEGEKELLLNPDCIESIAANPNFGMSSYAARTVIRCKTGAIHYVDEPAGEVLLKVRQWENR